MSQRRSTFDENFRAINDETTVWVVLEFAWKEMFQSRSGWTGFRTSCSFSIIVIQEENIFDMRLHEMLNRSATSWRNKPTCKGNNTRYSIQATLAASRDCLFLTLNTHHMSVIRTFRKKHLHDRSIHTSYNNCTHFKTLFMSTETNSVISCSHDCT